MGNEMNGTAVRPDKSKLYYPKMPRTWWLKKPAYFMFMLRELSSVFIAVFLIVFLVQIYQLTKGPEAYAAFVQKLSSPGWIVFHIVALLFALLHSITWFQSTAVVMPLRLGERELPRNLVLALNIGVWVAVSAAILILFLAFRG
jgi:fumarate reductase subunit C